MLMNNKYKAQTQMEVGQQLTLPGVGITRFKYVM